jgi:hypothetical protein
MVRGIEYIKVEVEEWIDMIFKFGNMNNRRIWNGRWVQRVNSSWSRSWSWSRNNCNCSRSRSWDKSWSGSRCSNSQSWSKSRNKRK